ncbi:MAG: hypothetical protein QOJ18_373, partial [Microbacteriaceae bacterium]|nr:hypothetical protein [Microbacteriaceae bacterium]
RDLLFIADSIPGVAMGREREAYALAVDPDGAVAYPAIDPAQFDFRSHAVVRTVNRVNYCLQA